MLKLYIYQKCSTCRNAVKWLTSRHIPFEERAIRETPPTPAEIKHMLQAKGHIRALFNASGMDYRALGLKDKLPTMSRDEAVKLLTSNGNLVKRPFALDESRGIALVGFKEPEWRAAFS